jgi:WD40 repeat protein/tRNA A-37 threonylcarbamoyl transferase component Bud32
MRIGPYEIQGEIGRGGIGVVFKARAPDGRVVAIKLLQRQDGSKTQRFDRERRILAALSEKDGFVPLIDSGDSNQGPYLVMPFVEGGTLRRRLGRGPLGIDDAVALGVELATAIGRAHALGIVHRDLKPDNVIFERDGTLTREWGRALILDLGLAKHFSRDPSTGSVSLSKTGESMGTVAYMAPEQAANTKGADARADVFSLGAILYECLAGDPAFEGDTTLEVFGLIQSGNFTPLRKRCPDAPRWLALVIERTLAVNPARRHSDGAALARALAAGAGAGTRWAAAVVAALAVVAVGATVAWKGVAGLRPPSTAPAPPPRVERPKEPTAARALHEAHGLKLTATWGTYAGRHAGMVLDVEISPDATLVATSSMDGAIRIWDAEDLRPLHGFVGHDGKPVDSVAFVGGSKLLLSAGRDGLAKLWDVERERELARLTGHKGEVRGLAVSRDGKLVLTGSKDARIGVWELPSGKLVRWLEGHEGFVNSLAFSPDEKRALSAGLDGTLRLWDLESGKLLRTFDKQPKMLQSVSFSPDGAKALCASEDPVIRIFDVATGKLDRTFEGHTGWAVSAMFSADGKRILSGSFDETMRIFAVETGATERIITGHAGWVSHARWFPGEKRIVSGSNDMTARLWDASSGAELHPGRGHRGPCTSIAITADGRTAFTSGFDATVLRWDVAKGSQTRELAGHTSPVQQVVVSDDGRRALSGSGAAVLRLPGELILWDAETGSATTLAERTAERLDEGGCAYTAVALTPDGRRGASASVSKSGPAALAWYLEGTPSSKPIENATAGAISLAATPDGAVYAGTQAGAQGWDLDLARAQPFTTKPITAFAFMDPQVLAAEHDGEIVGWDRSDPAQTSELRFVGHKGTVTSLAISKDRKLAVSSGVDGTVRLWSFERKGEIGQIVTKWPADSARAVAFLPDGTSILVASGLGPVLRFDLTKK